MPFIGKISAIKKKGEGDNLNKENKQESKFKQGVFWLESPKLDEPRSVEIENNAVLSVADSGTSLNKDEREYSAKTVNFQLIVGSTATANSTSNNILSTISAPIVPTTNATIVSISDNSSTTTTVSSNKINTIKEQVLPRSTLILSKTLGVSSKSAALLKKKKMFDDGIAGGVEDMDIEIDDKDELSEENLPKDFQDALDILFPTETAPVENFSSENQSLTNSSVPNAPTINIVSIGQNHSNVTHNSERLSNAVNSEPGHRNVLPIGHIPGLVHQYGINSVPPMGPIGGPGHINNVNSSGHLKPSLLGPGPREQIILKHDIPCDRQIGPELEATSGRQVNCRPDFNMISNRMGQCLMGPGPDHGLSHLNHQQMGGPKMMMPSGGGPGASVCSGIMGPGPPTGPISLGPPGPHSEPRPVGIGPQGMLPFGDEPGNIDTDRSCGFIFKRKNPPSQKKRLQLKKRRDMLEAREKELTEKIAELQGKVANEENIEDGQSDINNKKDDSKKMELAMLGIDEDDICCK